MSEGTVHISSREPAPPDGAEFAIVIDFKRGEGSPQRVFQAADAMIRAMQKLDNALCYAIDSTIEPMMVLEDVESGSVKVWLRNKLQALDDQALKELDWRPAIGKYLVRAKYVFIEWANSGDGSRLPSLRESIKRIASETDVRHIPAYSEPSTEDLVDTLGQVEAAKRHLIEGDKMAFLSREGDEKDFDLSVQWETETIESMATKETVKFEPAPMILTVKRPDYLGTSKWDFRHGKRPISAKIEDVGWLSAFHHREKDVRPGDALRCLVVVEHAYGYDNELVSEKYTVTKVEEVLEAVSPPSDLFEEDRG